MDRVIVEMAMSVDGFIAGPNGEDRGLHDYFFSPSRETAKVIEDSINTAGAIIMGGPQIQLELEQVIAAPDATHLRYRVIQPAL